MTRDHLPSGLASVFTRAASVRVNNVMNPVLWLVAVGMPVSFAAAYFAGFESAIGMVLVGIGALPLIVGCLLYAWFAIRAPDRLQSEEYLLRQQEILILSKSGTAQAPDLEALASNPLLPDAPLGPQELTE
jgi:hypothetical protein